MNDHTEAEAHVAARLSELGSRVDVWTRQELAGLVSPPADRFLGMLEYHLGWRDQGLARLASPAPSGKKLRPTLALLVCEAVRGTVEAARAAAVAVELVHNFSLVHDDIQDASAVRRHRATLWSLWGMEQGINAGDALFALAQVVLLRDGSAMAARMGAELGRTCLLLAEGQFLDIDLQRDASRLTLAAYDAMIARKTGALFACACRLGALAAEAPPSVQDAYAAFGLELGIAFQEQDDLLGVWGAPEETGKPRAADVATRKKGLPAAIALGRRDPPPWLRAAYGDDGGADMPAALVERVVVELDALGVRAEAERRIAARYASAMGALDRAGPWEPARTSLAGICRLLVSRRT